MSIFKQAICFLLDFLNVGWVGGRMLGAAGDGEAILTSHAQGWSQTQALRPVFSRGLDSWKTSDYSFRNQKEISDTETR